MDGMRMRTIASLLVLGLALWGPGMPLALAQVDVSWETTAPECRAAFDQLSIENPALATECNRILEATVEASTNPETASPAAKGDLRAVEAAVEQGHATYATAAQLAVPEVAELATNLTQTAGVTAPVAQDLSLRAQAAFNEAKTAFASYDPGKAEEVLKSFQGECARYGVSPETFFGGAREGLDFRQIACDPRGNFLDRAGECHTVVETYKDLVGKVGTDFDITGGLGDRDKVLQQIQGMDVPEAERAKMEKTFHACDAAIKEGDFDKLREVIETAAREAYEKAMMEHGGVMTQGDVARMLTEHGTVAMPFAPETMTAISGIPMEHYGASSPFTADMMAAGVDPRMLETYHTVDSSTATSGSTSDTQNVADTRADTNAQAMCLYGHAANGDCLPPPA